MCKFLQKWDYSRTRASESTELWQRKQRVGKDGGREKTGVYTACNVLLACSA